MAGKHTTARALFDEVETGSPSKSAAKQNPRTVLDCWAIGHGSSIEAQLSFRRGVDRTTMRSVGRPLREPSVVHRSSDLDLGDGRTLPAGAEGAIVSAHGGGKAYEAELATPFHAVATVPAPNLSQAT